MGDEAKVVPVRPSNTAELNERLKNPRDHIRKRAYDLFCQRGCRPGRALDDWLQAEREFSAARLASVAEGENEIRITVCVPARDAGAVGVDALPTEIVVEMDRNGEVERFRSFELPAKVEPDEVKARLRGGELCVVAPKALRD